MFAGGLLVKSRMTSSSEQREQRVECACQAKTIGPNGVLGVYLCFSEGLDLDLNGFDRSNISARMGSDQISQF